MELTEEKVLPLAREVVWQALNDPDILREALPGCESMKFIAEDRLEAVMVTKLGPIKARFRGEIQLQDICAPESCLLIGEGKGGAAGFAKGSARILLEERQTDSPSTLMRYHVEAAVGGRLARIGSRLVQGAAKKLAGDFFSRFARAAARPIEESTEKSAVARQELKEQT